MEQLFGANEVKKITAKEMESYLAVRYSNPEWVFLPQVRSSTGTANRIADGMAFNMYHSTGYEIIGFEIKVSRSDWLSELKDMSKSNEIMEYCDKWYLVVSDASIVKDGELPKNWGLLVLKDDKLVQKIRPTPQKTVQMPLPFVASLLRRSGDEIVRIRNQYIKREDIAGQLEEARKRGYEDASGWSGKRTKEELENLRGLVAEFEKSSGIKFDTWKGKQYGASLGLYVKFAMDIDENKLVYHIRSIESAITSLEGAKKEVIKIQKHVKSIEE